nr:odorant receptor 12 [Diaphania glauculalis]
MTTNNRKVAETEIRQTLNISNIFMRMNGLSFIDKPPRNFVEKLKVHLKFVVASSLLFWMLVGEIAFTASLLAGSVSVEELIKGYVHIAGYDTMSFGKLIMVRYQNHAFQRLVSELPDIWPGPGVDEASAAIKRSSLQALRIMQIFYMCWNVFGVWMYNLTPVALHLYHIIQGESSNLGYIWHLYYPFDQTQVVVHGFVFIFEMFGGLSSVNAMLSADILFITMASHISMLLRILQVKIRRIGTEHEQDMQDNYDQIVDVIKIHQRLISYGNDLEQAFTMVNLLNVLLSSVNICCVVFSIVFLEPVMEMSNKLFIGAALTQMGVVCWYADNIYRASVGVADAVYESGWYRCDPRSRRALLVMLQRSQRPLYFTALKFRSITMMTFSSILTTAYSYFTLLYTSYSS